MSYTARNETTAVVRDSDGAIIGPENVAEWAAYQEWLALGNVPTPAPLPSVATIALTFDEWLALFTADERAWAFASNDPTVREMIARGSAANAIDLASPTVAQFLDLVISLGSPLTTQRKAEVLAGTAPVVN
jgi:hypothetical protein